MSPARNGRFVKGGKAGPGAKKGNPVLANAQRLRLALLGAITPEDLEEIVGVLVQRAKAGEAWAIREVLNRTVGREPLALELRAAQKRPASECFRCCGWPFEDGHHPDCKELPKVLR